MGIVVLIFSCVFACTIDADCPPFQGTCGANGFCKESPDLPDRNPVDFAALKSKAGDPWLDTLNAPIYSSWIDALELTSDPGAPVLDVGQVVFQGFGLDRGATTFDLVDGAALDFAVPCAVNFD